MCPPKANPFERYFLFFSRSFLDSSLRLTYPCEQGAFVLGLFPFDFKKAILVIFVLALPIISINFQRAPGEEPWFLKPFIAMTGSVQGGFSSVSSGIRNTVVLYLNLINVKKRNQYLEKEISELKVGLATFEKVQLENARLQNLLKFSQDLPAQIVAARVIGLDLFTAGQHATIRIDRGENHGLKKGMAVVSPDGVVGTLLTVSGETSQILVLTDRYAVVDSIVRRSRARGVVEGKNSSSLRLKYLQRTDDIEVGDIVDASGIDNIFPDGFPIGTVTAVEKKTYGITQEVEVRPFVNPSRLEEIFVIIKSMGAMPSTTPAEAPAETETGT